ncbi:hypothetical protein CKALI_03725 [Corynebacterium kalinowskii]|uniref:Uncharacterized protein n=1 Tax=Corynebacterium kalinowskii TaxID=2675216 RepID=A0A6B8VSB3_9CORY|nr:hypothetical protein CKALI_03725 [Corynebacterium kalinowskii]
MKRTADRHPLIVHLTPNLSCTYAPIDKKDSNLEKHSFLQTLPWKGTSNPLSPRLFEKKVVLLVH